MHPSSSFVTAFTRLGLFLRQFPEETGPQSGAESPDLAKLNKEYYMEFSEILEHEPVLNPWFTRESLMMALKGIAGMLAEEVLMRWLQAYGIKAISPMHKKLWLWYWLVIFRWWVSTI